MEKSVSSTEPKLPTFNNIIGYQNFFFEQYNRISKLPTFNNIIGYLLNARKCKMNAKKLFGITVW